MNDRDSHQPVAPTQAGTLGELTLALCEALDESLTQQEGWIARYCHTRYRQEHMNDVAKKRAVLAAVRRQLDAMKP